MVVVGKNLVLHDVQWWTIARKIWELFEPLSENMTTRHNTKLESSSSGRAAIRMDHLLRRLRQSRRMKTCSWIIAIGIVMPLSSAQAAHATVIAVYRSSDQIIIAADSLRNVETIPPSRMLVCKIRSFGDIVFASSGRSSLPGGVFSLDAMTANLRADESLVSGGVRNRISKFEKYTVGAFKRVQYQSRQIGPITFTYILSFVEEGEPIVYSKTLKSVDGKAEIGGVETVAEDQVLLVGQPEYRNHRSSVRVRENATPSELLEAIIVHQAQGLPDKVGEPVDIIRITASGVEWLQRKPNCRKRE